MMRRRSTLGLFALAGVWWAAACGTLSEASGGDAGPCVGPECEPIDASKDKNQPDTLPPGDADASKPKVNPLCGTGDPCVADYGAPGACSQSDASPGLEAGLAEAGDGSPQFSPPGTGADAGLPGPANGDFAFGCYVSSDDGKPVSECLPAGKGVTGSPCVAPSDCAAGFACVGLENAAQCRPYCCEDPESCPGGMFCTERQLAETELHVPVCAPADNCNLAEQYPCPAGSNCTCEGDTACMVVREKTTSCIVPGSGKEGDSCPCAWGHICSKAINECLKLCQTTSSTPDCGTAKCTPVSELPDGWGVCAQ